MDGAKAIVLSGNRLGVLDGNDDFYARDGLTGEWTLQMDGAKAIALADTVSVCSTATTTSTPETASPASGPR